MQIWNSLDSFVTYKWYIKMKGKNKQVITKIVKEKTAFSSSVHEWNIVIICSFSFLPVKKYHGFIWISMRWFCLIKQRQTIFWY